MPSEKAIVIGAGIAGLALARSLALRGFFVTVIERNEKAIGASIRNFGMLWPIGQPDGALYEMALKSKAIWKEVATAAHLWFEESGSLHLAYNQTEWQVLQEFAAACGHRPVAALAPYEVLKKSEAVKAAGLLGGLYSADEMIIESRAAMAQLPAYLTEVHAVHFAWHTAVTAVDYPYVITPEKVFTADRIFVCSGADFATLYPAVFRQHQFIKCKLQMLRLAAQPGGWRIGPSLCRGLSLIHYKSFEAAPSLPALCQLFQNTMPAYLQWGIHVMVSQNGSGELTVGDSHEYGAVHEPFDKAKINELILAYLAQFANFKNTTLVQAWNGVYARQASGAPYFFDNVTPGVWLLNGLGGAGMTLSFGLAETVCNAM